MKKAGLFLSIILFFRCTGTNSDSYPGSVISSTFEATTPCGTTIRKILGINDANYEMMKWTLTLYNDPQKTDQTFDLVYEYGIPKQGTRGFKEGSKKIELSGNWVTEKNDKNKLGTVVMLNSASLFTSLSFLHPDENILHMLDENKKLLVGTAAWSYTLHNNKPAISQTSFSAPINSPATLESKDDTLGIFEGRTPCADELTRIHDISADGCQGIKCQLVILKNGEFVLKTIYVGKGDIKYSRSGKWKSMQTKDAAISVYQLVPGAGKPGPAFLLLKADDNILFFLDNNGKLLVGNNYFSYTLNKVMK